MTTALEGNTLLLDQYLPEFHLTKIVHLVVDAPPEVAYETMRDTDLLTVHSPLMDAAMFVRTLPERINWALGRKRPPSTPPPTMKLSGLFDTGVFEAEADIEGWVGLAEERGRELVFGAIGKPWMADIDWKTIPSFEFASFDEPGWAKIAASISVRPYGSERSILTYEARTALTDPASEKRFRRYWLVVSPFVGEVMSALLRTVAKRAAKVPAPGD